MPWLIRGPEVHVRVVVHLRTDCLYVYRCVPSYEGNQVTFEITIVHCTKVPRKYFRKYFRTKVLSYESTMYESTMYESTMYESTMYESTFVRKYFRTFVANNKLLPSYFRTS